MACGRRVGARHASNGEGPKPEPTRGRYRRLERLAIDELPVTAVGHRPFALRVSYAVDQLDRAEEHTAWKVRPAGRASLEMRLGAAQAGK